MKRQTDTDVLAGQDEKVHLIMEHEAACVLSSSDMHRSATPTSTPSGPLDFLTSVRLSTSERVCSAACVFPFCSVSLLTCFIFLHRMGPNTVEEDNCLTEECVTVIIRL